MSALAVSVRRDAHADAPAEVSSAALAAQAREEAAAALSNMEEFFNWLNGECIDHTSVDSERLTRHPELRDLRIAAAPTPQLAHLWTNGDSDDASAARAELQSRYLRTQS